MICPFCGHEVSGKAKLGTGTRKAMGMKRLGPNKMAILNELILAGKHLNVRQLQKILFDKRVQRIHRNGSVGGFNYHEVQADLSMLVGAGLVDMTKAKEEWDDEAQEYVADPVPVYIVKDMERAKDIIANGGVIKREKLTDY